SHHSTQVATAVALSRATMMIQVTRAVVRSRKSAMPDLVISLAARGEGRSNRGACQRGHDLVRDQSHQLVSVRGRRCRPTVHGRTGRVRAAEGEWLRYEVIILVVEAAGTAHAHIFLAEPHVVVAKPLLQVEQLAGLLVAEVVDAAQLAGQDQDLAVGVDDL